MPFGHTLTFEESLVTVLERMGTIFVMPRALLRMLPIHYFRSTYLAFREWTSYMHEMCDEIIPRIEEVASKKTKSILGKGCFVLICVGYTKQLYVEAIVVAGTPGLTNPVGRPLPSGSILGDVFFTLIAGHETSGSTMGFTMILLAIYPEYQKQLHAELDRQFGGRSTLEWTYDNDYQTLQSGYTGAVLKEVLRLYSPVQFLTKETVTTSTVFDSKGNQHVVPKDTICLMNFPGAFQNPEAWAKSKVSLDRERELHNSPACQFDPSRWLLAKKGSSASDSSYHPFGQGPRACPGKAFALIEMTAVLSTIFKKYSLELVVSQETLQACNDDANLAWKKTRDSALKMLIDDIECNITIYLSKELPIRLVERLETP